MNFVSKAVIISEKIFHNELRIEIKDWQMFTQLGFGKSRRTG
jgi:hypothetical protein